MTPAVATWMLKELVENDAQHADLTDNLDWYFLPVHNPDGYEYSRSDKRDWRKNNNDLYLMFLPSCMVVFLFHEEKFD